MNTINTTKSDFKVAGNEFTRLNVVVDFTQWEDSVETVKLKLQLIGEKEKHCEGGTSKLLHLKNRNTGIDLFNSFEGYLERFLTRHHSVFDEDRGSLTALLKGCIDERFKQDATPSSISDKALQN